MEPTKYHNLYRTTGVFKYIYKEDNFEIGGRDWNDLKFKLAIQGIKLQEKTDPKTENIVKKETDFSNKKQIKPVRPKHKSKKPAPKNKPLKKDIDFIESEEDVGFGKIVRPGEIERWGPDNSERARKLRKDLIR